MKTFATLTVSLLLSAALAPSACAQGDSHWEKSYALSGQPSLILSTDDSNLTIKACGDCHTVRIHVDARNRKLSDYRLEEDQSGDTVHFSLKEKVHAGLHFTVNWHNNTSVAVEVETPANLTLHAETSDGNLNASGLNGAISLRSSDGQQSIVDVTGALTVQSSDGSVNLRNVGGTLEARTSDGNLDITGKLDGLNVRTSDGRVTLQLVGGSKLKTDSTLHTSDGQVTVRLPSDLSANLDLSTSDGKIDCSLPLTLDGFHTSGESEHSVRGKLNGGGALLTIHTGDGSLRVSSL